MIEWAKMVKVYKKFLQSFVVIGVMFATAFISYSYGRAQREIEIAALKAEVIEGVATEELEAIYNLLSAAAFTNRANMNLAAKTNHYITHPQGRDGRPPNVACEECWQEFSYVVENMPKMDPPNEAYFDSFYRQRYRQWKKLREEQN